MAATLSAWIAAVAGSLRLRLLLGSLLALGLGVGITTGVLLQRAERDMLSTREQLELGEALRTARQLGFRVQAQQQTLAVAARHLQAAPQASIDMLEQQLRDLPVLLAQFDSVFITDPSGRILVLHDEKGHRRPDVDLSDRPYVRRALAQGQPQMSAPMISQVSGQPVVVMVQPLPTASGAATGLLGAGLRLKSRDMLAGVAERDEEDEAGALVVVTDAQGILLAHFDPALVGAPVSAEPRLAAAVARWREAGAPVEPSGLAMQDPQNVVVLAGVAGPDWVVWRLRSRAGVLEPLLAGRTAALRWAAAMMVAASVLLALWVHLQMRPLTQLQARARRLFDPDLGADDGWPRASGEIGRLEATLRQVLSERQSLEHVNQRTLEQLHSVMSAAPVGIALTREHRFERVSQALCRMLGTTEAALLGQPAQVIHASTEDYQRLGVQAHACFARNEPYIGEWELLRADGSRFPARLRGQPVRWNDAGPGTIWTASDITEESATRRALLWAATHDSLTGLANRAVLHERLQRLFADGPLTEPPAALLVLDLDHFKPINDQHGHAAGDAMLRAVAAAMSACVRTGDLVARMGGDEFALLLESCPVDVAARVAEQVQQAVTGVRLPWKGELLALGCSIGVATLEPGHRDAEAWIAAADSACYGAKAAGRGLVHDAKAAPLRLVAGSQAGVLG